MGAVCGILGRCDAEAVRRMAQALEPRGALRHVVEGRDFAYAVHTHDAAPCLVDGVPRDVSGRALSAQDLLGHCLDAQTPDNLNLTGAFAAAIPLDQGRAWWLLRDRLGRKPLYYAEGDGWVIFASELKAIIASGLIPKHLNLSSLDRYLTLRCVPGPETILQGVYRVPPGHVVEYRAGELTQTLFAAFDFRTVTVSRDEAADELEELMRKALAQVDGQTLLWSGGLDCAALAGLAPRLEPLFIQLERGWQNETRHAVESARLLHRPLEQHTARRLTEDAFTRIVHALDEPMADASVLPLGLLLEEAGKHANTFVSGHGADELLGGYPRYHFLQKTHGARSLVPVSLLAEISPVLPPNAFIRRAGKYLTVIRDDLEAYLALISIFDDEERAALYTDAMKAVTYDRAEADRVLRHHFIHNNLTHNLLSLDLGVGVPDLLLSKCDRLAGAQGIAIEYPYLDDRIVDFASTLAPGTKFGVRSKPLLRLAMKQLVPTRVRLRARRDFHVPMDGRLAQVIEAITRQVITRDRVEATGVFRWPMVEQIVRSSTHNIYRRRQFWALLMFLGWYREFMEK